MAAGKLNRVNGSGNGIMLHSKKRLNVCGNATAEDNIITFTKPGKVALCKIMEPVSPMLNYFEIEILASGPSGNRENPLIGIGVGNRSYLPSNQPGWRKTSIGYHADDGYLYHKEEGRRCRGIAGRAFGPKCTTGDRMGCGIDFTPIDGSNAVLVFFTKNGQQVGMPQKMKRPSLGLYPLIGLHGEGEKVAYLGHRCRIPETLTEPMQTNGSPSDYWLRSNGVNFVESGCNKLEYAGMGGDYHTTDVGFAQANFPISCSNHYFELEILQSGNTCTVAIGLCKALHSMRQRLGLLKGSVGYHADSGQLFNGTRRPFGYGPSCTTGDKIGCGVRVKEETCSEWNEESGSDFEEDPDSEDELIIDYDSGPSDDSDYDFEPEERFAQRILVKQDSGDLLHHASLKARLVTVYFTKNGEMVKEMECSVPSGGFYPVVSMNHQGESISVNFEPYSG